jgi:hypothetical protein
MYMLVQYVRALLCFVIELMLDVPPTLSTEKGHLDLGHSLQPLMPSAGVFRYL